jgi:myo-inositol-1(or 4)-monophosphatase
MQLPESLLNDVTDLAREAGRFLLARRAGITIAEKDGAHNLVTQADLECEQMVCERLAQLLPDSQFLREEGGAVGDPTSAAMWIIDPLDGTNNYVHGIPQFCVSIGLAVAGEFELGVVYDPNRDEMFAAQQGCGATLNGQPIHVSERPDLQHSVIATGFYYDRGDLVKRTLAAIGRLFDEPIRGVRRFGSAALDLCWVACGRYDGYFEYRLGAWDYAAGAVIVREAGGQCSSREGKTLEVLSGNVIASSPQVHADLVRVVKWE